MTEIYIDNQLVDLYDNEEIVLTFSVNNLFSIESRTGTYSNTFMLPATNNNNRVFEHFNNLLSTTEKGFKVLSCQIFVDGILQIDGFAQIMNGNEIEYEVKVFGGNVNWFEVIQEKNIGEFMTRCEDAFRWTEAEVLSNRMNIWTDKFLYPNIDYGNLFYLDSIPPFDVDWFELYPAVYCKYLFKRIFEDSGYVIDSEWFNNDTLFEKQIIPFSARWRRDRLNYDLRNYFKAQLQNDEYYSILGNTPPSVPKKFLIPITNYNCFDFSNTEYWTDPNGQTYYNCHPYEYYQILDNATITFKYDISVDHWQTEIYQLSLMYYDFDGNAQEHLIYDINLADPLGIYNFQGEVTLEVGRGVVSFIGGDLYANQIIKANSYIEIKSYIPNESDSGVYEIDTFYNWGTLGGTMPEISATDFILTISNQYGLVFEQDQTNNRIKIFQFGNVVNNIPQSIDWSDKIDLEDKPTISTLFEDYTKNNFLNYAPDDNDTYLIRAGDFANGNIIVDFGKPNTETIIFESAFSPVIRLETFANGVAGAGVLELAYIPIFEGLSFNEVNGRMAYVDFDSTSLITIAGITEPVQPNVYFEQLTFSNLITEYYPLYKFILNNSKAVDCLLRINNLDIANLDFSKPIWIDHFNAYFYINEIAQYKVTSKDSTQVTLILITN